MCWRLGVDACMLECMIVACVAAAGLGIGAETVSECQCMGCVGSGAKGLLLGLNVVLGFVVSMCDKYVTWLNVQAGLGRISA